MSIINLHGLQTGLGGQPRGPPHPGGRMTMQISLSLHTLDPHCSFLVVFALAEDDAAPVCLSSPGDPEMQRKHWFNHG